MDETTSLREIDLFAEEVPGEIMEASVEVLSPTKMFGWGSSGFCALCFSSAVSCAGCGSSVSTLSTY